ncbi:Peptide chain release factor RF1 [Polystyrenella longa]|uniref:Peptide chain release factor 1 n=1 Tax=Polystyrenella longa TaxID=2528007 RepID=A0A518CJ40_9PLAN|nr:peptide chain release factor 1 [Polystyrenella longa]QDU79230.1 Peptide chain release factor RF1 [Polystyrenella longa]
MFPSLESKLKRYEEIDKQMTDPETMSDPAKFIPLQREQGGLAKVAKAMQVWRELTENIATAKEMVDEETDAESREYAQAELDELNIELSKVEEELEELVTAGDSITRGGLIMEIRAGTGGDEAGLFAGNLFDMYTRLIERRGWKYEIIDAQPTELGGFKEMTFSITGDGAFHQLQFESGGHRVQRVPETETQGRIHTSAATVAVLPEATEVELDIKPDDLRIDTFHASGPGGQKVNKTESAIRITHLPSGVVVQCQDEKSQHKNRAKAMRVLRGRVLEAKQREEQEKRASYRRTLIGSGDRSQRIRTYNFPQGRVTDHRINLTLYKLDRVLLGEMDELIEGLLEFDRQERLNNPDPA